MHDGAFGYAEDVNAISGLLLVSALVTSCWAQPSSSRAAKVQKFDANRLPRFEDFPATENWNGVSAPVRLTTRSERMFRTRLTEAGKEPPNFAGHYRLEVWGCGSNCRAGAVVDLKTGSVFPLPLAAHGEGWGRWRIGSEEIERSVDSRPNSRLAIVSSRDIPDVYYFVWENNRFSQLVHVSSKTVEH